MKFPPARLDYEASIPHIISPVRRHPVPHAMNKLMYDDPSIRRDWTTIVQWDDENIKGFFGEYRWLSNFHPCVVNFEGIQFGSSENAYMAAKTEDLALRKRIAGMKSYEAKKIGRSIKLREGWNSLKLGFMHQILTDKFTGNADLRDKLMATGQKYLEETNWWRDQFWGVQHGEGGQNHLGKILMQIRETLTAATL